MVIRRARWGYKAGALGWQGIYNIELGDLDRIMFGGWMVPAVASTWKTIVFLRSYGRVPTEL